MAVSTEEKIAAPPRRGLGILMRNEHVFLVLLLAVLTIGLSFAAPRFMTPENATAVLHQSAMVLIVALGMTVLLITAEVDISVGASLAFASCVVMDVINITDSLTLGILAGIGFGGLVGLFNGLVVTKLKVNSLIATIATMMMLQGGVFLYTREAVQNHHQIEAFALIATGFVGPVPVPVLIATVLLVLAWAVLRFTLVGRYAFAVGANPKSARLSGLSPERVKLGAFVLTGLLVGVSSVILASLLNAGQPTAGRGFELIVIAAVLLGGTSLFGGRGTIAGTLLAVLILKIIDNGIILLRWNQDLQIIVPGIVIILALFLDQLRKGRTDG